MPIAMNSAEWDRLQRWSEHDKEDQETLRRREYVQYLNATSKEMTKTWPNSLENVNKRNEELRRARLDAAEAANANFYKGYVKKKKQEQERLMYSARDTIFKNKDAPKLLLSAVIETVVQKERIEQLKFLEARRREEAEQKRRDDDDIIRRAKEWNELMALKARRRFEANKQHQKEILDQAHEVAERNRIEHETELNLQKSDNTKAHREMKAIKQFEDDFKATEKNRIWTDMERSRQENEARRQEQIARDKLDDRLIDVLNRARASVEQRRKKTEHDIKQEKLRVLEQISLKLESGDAARDAKEQANLEKAVQEKEAIAEVRRQAEARKLQQFREQRAQQRQEFLRDEARRLREAATATQWDMMNRFKNAELYEDFKENLSNDKKRKIKEYREEILRLWKEREDREARERAETRYFYGSLAEQKLRHADDKLLRHADVLVQEAREHGRPEHALMRAVDRYCKMYRLYPMPDLPKSLQEHFTRYAPADRSRPHAASREPPPPTFRPQGGAPKKDGLQEQAGPSQPAAAASPAEPEDGYRRAGRADGLQRRPATTDVILPPIPVPSKECCCEPKQ